MADIDTTSILGALAALATALLAMRLLAARFGAPPLRGRYAAIDGLRGYLGLFVFLHHACVWFGYLRSGAWTAPAVAAGAAAVALAWYRSFALMPPLSRALGELAYGLYLLHGLLLFVLFRFVIGFDRAAAFSPARHWLLVAGVAPLLVLLCFAAFRLIEAPAMVRSGALAAWLRRLGALKMA